MNSLNELSGTLQKGILFLPWANQRESVTRFPENTAIGLVQSFGGELESAWPQNSTWSMQPARKPQREGVFSEFLAHTHALWQDSRKKLMDEVDALKASYAFRNEDAIARFCCAHISAIPFLSNAAVELKRSFGEDAVLNLEGIFEDDDSASLYAIVVWRGDVESAEAALDEFDERWWFNQGAQPRLTFTYELA